MPRKNKKNRKTKKSELLICEWCGITYPAGGFDYWVCETLTGDHMICKDCKEKMYLFNYNNGG